MSIERLSTLCPETSATLFNFLADKPFLVSLLLEMIPQIHKRFPGAPVSLELMEDLEYYPKGEIIVSIHTALEVEEADRRLDQFDEEWWLPNIARSQGYVTVDMRFS